MKQFVKVVNKTYRTYKCASLWKGKWFWYESDFIFILLEKVSNYTTGNYSSLANGAAGYKLRDDIRTNE